MARCLPGLRGPGLELDWVVGGAAANKQAEETGTVFPGTAAGLCCQPLGEVGCLSWVLAVGQLPKAPQVQAAAAAAAGGPAADLLPPLLLCMGAVAGMLVARSLWVVDCCFGHAC